MEEAVHSKGPTDAPRQATIALAALPYEISEASRLGLIPPERFVQIMVRHVRAEMRRNGDLTVADLDAKGMEHLAELAEDFEETDTR